MKYIKTLIKTYLFVLNVGLKDQNLLICVECSIKDIAYPDAK